MYDILQTLKMTLIIMGRFLIKLSGEKLVKVHSTVEWGILLIHRV